MTTSRSLPAPAFARRLNRARRLWEWLALATGVLIAVKVVSYLYLAFASYVVERTGSRVTAGIDSPAVQAWFQIEIWWDITVILLGAVLLIVWLRLIWLSAVLAERISPGSVRYAPWVAVAGFLVPIVSLWMPVYTMSDLGNVFAREEGRSTDAFPWIPALIVTLALVSFGLDAASFDISGSAPIDMASARTALHLAAAGGAGKLLLLLACDGFLRAIRPGQEIALADLSSRERAWGRPDGDRADSR
ncbi:uncharacterized protein DUF4328 [Ciceribacter lividus]|uniref:Uncharacterized protein DUF4328 n=1 Tax=Ciceribacter lividus TaxID=1197950 RepID=A0A6I7HP06_9HYPH|nr:DUF4328 domain-containing protein [Ciceribacter lividus]RCW27459.1 uncharacterized protein DUF4328 [Ciceribacter lividus]